MMSYPSVTRNRAVSLLWLIILHRWLSVKWTVQSLLGAPLQSQVINGSVAHNLIMSTPLGVRPGSFKPPSHFQCPASINAVILLLIILVVQLVQSIHCVFVSACPTFEQLYGRTCTRTPWPSRGSKFARSQAKVRGRKRSPRPRARGVFYSLTQSVVERVCRSAAL